METKKQNHMLNLTNLQTIQLNAVGFSTQFGDLQPTRVTCMPAMWVAGRGGDVGRNEGPDHTRQFHVALIKMG